MTLSFSLCPSIVTRVDRDGVGRLWVGRRGGHDPDVIRIEGEACGGSGESFLAVLDGAESR